MTPKTFHVKDYPTREAQWVAAMKYIAQQKALEKLTRLAEESPGGYR